MKGSSKLDIIRIQKYMKPSGCCQACLSQTQLSKDCIITCQICRSCIHQTHYGSELLQPPQVWQCERCRYFLEHGPCDIYCQFCPSLRGIMKQYAFQNRKIWLHPECAVWGFPIIFFVSNKKEGIRREKPKSQSSFFWVRDFDSNETICSVCQGKQGYHIKCKYYNCTTSYHVTCARPEGVIRDLESMKIQGNMGYFPVYCKLHIQLKIQDAKRRVRLLKEKGQIQKASHFYKVSNLFTVQLKNLEAAVKRCKLEEQMIMKMSMQACRNLYGNESASLSELQGSFTSEYPSEFIQILQQQMVDERLSLRKFDEIKLLNEPQHNPTTKKGRNRVAKQQQNQRIYVEIPQQLSEVVKAQVIDIEPNGSLPVEECHQGIIYNSQSESQEDKHKVNSYQMMFEDF